MKQDNSSKKGKLRDKRASKKAQTQTEELKCQNKVDKVTRTNLADSLRELKQISDERKVILEQKKLQEQIG